MVNENSRPWEWMAAVFGERGWRSAPPNLTQNQESYLTIMAERLATVAAGNKDNRYESIHTLVSGYVKTSGRQTIYNITVYPVRGVASPQYMLIRIKTNTRPLPVEFHVMEYDEGIQGGALRSAEYSLVNQHFGSGTQLVKVSDFEKLMAMGYVALKDWVAGEEITKDNLIALKWETPNMPTWSKTMDEIVADLNTILRKYEINTIERMRHFLTQCMKESNRGRWLREHDQLIDRNGWNDAQIQNNFEKNYSYSYPFNYRGVGYIHLTFRYGYQAFATYLLKERYPELNVRWGSPINTDAAAIETNYNNAVNAAQNKGHNIKLYTDIVDIGTTHVATYFAWETAGYFWMSTRLNDTVDTLKANDPDEVDKVTAVVNKYDIASSYEDRRNFYREVKNIIK